MENKLTANELRIGNYLLIDGIAQKVEAFMPNGNEVKFNKGDYFKISFEHYKHKVTYETESDEDVEPILLNEEWLLKFGFEYHHDTPHPNKVYRKHWLEGFFDLEKIVSFHFGGNFIDVNIKYVHQLQNLYFALTNEELTIK
jgi:hypothetical protein